MANGSNPIANFELIELRAALGDLLQAMSTDYFIHMKPGIVDPIQANARPYTRDDAIQAAKKFADIFEGWAKALSSPHLIGIPGAPHPVVLRRVIQHGDDARPIYQTYAFFEVAMQGEDYHNAVMILREFMQEATRRSEPTVAMLIEAIELCLESGEPAESPLVSSTQREAIQALAEADAPLTAVRIYRAATGSAAGQTPSNYREMLAELLIDACIDKGTHQNASFVSSRNERSRCGLRRLVLIVNSTRS